MAKRRPPAKPPTAADCEVVRLQLARGTKRKMDELAARDGRLQYRLTSGVLDWFSDQSDSTRLLIMREVPRPALAHAVRDLLRSLLPSDLDEREARMLADEIRAHAATPSARE